MRHFIPLLLTILLLAGCTADRTAPSSQPPSDTVSSAEPEEPAGDIVSEPPAEERLPGESARYENAALGLQIQLPASWPGNYTYALIQEQADYLGGDYQSLCFYYKDTDEMLCSILILSPEAWQQLQPEPGPLGNYLGENSRYVFIGNGPNGSIFEGTGTEDETLFNRLRMRGGPDPSTVSITEPQV